MALRRGIGSPPAGAGESKAQRLKGKPDTDTKLHANLGAVLAEGQATVGMGEYRALRVDQIERDPTQPRDDLPTKEQVIACRERGLAVVPEDKRGAMEALMGLAKSIKAVGLQQAIVVVTTPPGSEARYRIKVGERRYLAHVYLGQEFIHAVIRPTGSDTDADSLHFAQLIENIQREELSLAQKLRGLRRLASYIEATSADGTLTAEDIEHILGYKRSQSFLYRRIVSDYDERVVDAVERGDVGKLEDVYALIQLPEEERPQAIERLKQGLPAKDEEAVAVPAQQVEPPAPEKKAAPKKKPANKPGRAKTVIALGSLSSAKVARQVIESVVATLDKAIGIDLDQVDWEDFKSVESLWREVVRHLEAEHG